MFISITPCFPKCRRRPRSSQFRGRFDPGGGPDRTTLQIVEVCAPAFLVPFMFVLDPAGVGMLLTGRSRSWASELGSVAMVTQRFLRHRRARRRCSGMVMRRTNLIVALDAHRRRLMSFTGAAFRLIGFAWRGVVLIKSCGRWRSRPLSRYARLVHAKLARRRGDSASTLEIALRIEYRPPCRDTRSANSSPSARAGYRGYIDDPEHVGDLLSIDGTTSSAGCGGRSRDSAGARSLTRTSPRR